MHHFELPPDATAIGISMSADRTLITVLHGPDSSRSRSFDALVWLKPATLENRRAHLPALRDRNQQLFLR